MKRHNLILLLFAAGNLLDIHSTATALAQPGFAEVNPFMAALFNRFGVLPGLLTVKAAAVTGAAVLRDAEHFNKVVGALTLGLFIVAAHNYMLLI